MPFDLFEGVAFPRVLGRRQVCTVSLRYLHDTGWGICKNTRRRRDEFTICIPVHQVEWVVWESECNRFKYLTVKSMLVQKYK